MLYPLQKSLILGLATTTSLALGAIAAVTLPTSTSVAAPNTAGFPDVQGYWAQPFIEPLAEQNVIAGYLDGTFRPTQPMSRDEFAAIVKSAFSQPPERQLASGSVYKDVPQGYWAVPAIEDAYEMGFVQGYPDGSFRPQQSITRASALSSLAQNLNLPDTTPASQPVAAVSPPVQAAPSPANPQSTRPQAKQRRTIMFPLAMTTLMQPLMSRPAQASPASAQAAQPTTDASAQTQQPAPPQPASAQQLAFLRETYVDADQIPPEAVDNIAAATRAGIVVNHPDPNVLNPNQPATRAEVAAWVHQALVKTGKMTPVANNPAAAYVVNPR